jgi:hypothetical protein
MVIDLPNQLIQLPLYNIPVAPPPQVNPIDDYLNLTHSDLTCTPDPTKIMAHRPEVGLTNMHRTLYFKERELDNKFFKYTKKWN